MSRRPKRADPAAAAAAINDRAQYAVELARVVTLQPSGIFLCPGHRTVVSGRVLKAIRADVVSFKEVH